MNITFVASEFMGTLIFRINNVYFVINYFNTSKFFLFILLTFLVLFEYSMCVWI